MEKKVYEAPVLEEAGSFEDVTRAIQGGTVIDQAYIDSLSPGDPIDPNGGAFS